MLLGDYCGCQGKDVGDPGKPRACLFLSPALSRVPVRSCRGLSLTGVALEAWSFKGCRNPTFDSYVGIEHLASLVAQECGGLRVSLSLFLT